MKITVEITPNKFTRWLGHKVLTTSRIISTASQRAMYATRTLVLRKPENVGS